jgi:diguanylate cyclase (GGDEF)-like protein
MSDTTEPAPGQRVRVLVIDDSRVVRVSLKKVLSAEFDIVEAEDGEAGWEALLADEQIQVVLTDAGMPRLDGYGLIERIRQQTAARIRDIPINMVTAADDEAARQRALDLGATDFITKPFDKAQLLARVRAQARLDQTTRDLAETAEALVEQATEDAQTGVHSRRYFLKRGEQDLAFANRHQQELSVLVIAIDGFEQLQTQHGTELSQQMLVTVASSLQNAIRKEDTLARTGEGQFAILAPTLAATEAKVVGDRIRRQIAAIAFADDKPVTLTVSLGLATRETDTNKGIEDYLTLAESYVTKALAAGGNRLVAAASAAAARKAVSIDAALRILAQGDPQRLAPHLDTIARQILPLLALCNRQQQWGLEAQLRAIEEKVNAG